MFYLEKISAKKNVKYESVVLFVTDIVKLRYNLFALHQGFVVFKIHINLSL